MRMIASTVLFVATAGFGGCSSSRPVEVTYRFENVRTIGGLDEWREIKKVLDDHAIAPVVGEVTAEKANVGNTLVRDYETTFRVESFGDLDGIESDLRDLSGERFGSERVQFSLSGVTADYRSTFVATAIEVSIRGVTTPRAIVFLYPSPKGAPLVASADAKGNFKKALPALPEGRAIYGYSQPAGTTGTVGRKYFRIDTVTQMQQTLTEEEFYEVVPPPKTEGRK